jgi:hypothetical protein
MVAQLYPRALGSLYVVSYDSQGYSGGILTRLHTYDTNHIYKYIFLISLYYLQSV